MGLQHTAMELGDRLQAAHRGGANRNHPAAAGAALGYRLHTGL